MSKRKRRTIDGKYRVIDSAKIRHGKYARTGRAAAEHYESLSIGERIRWLARQRRCGGG